MIKAQAGQLVASLNPQCSFDRALFVIGHMRCGSTALSHILCSRPEVSGYGEAHIAYRDQGALGVLVLNQLKRGAWRSDSGFLFDKILHQRYDAEACPDFFRARAVFMAREPVSTIKSIRKLFGAIRSTEFADDVSAADYYEQRLSGLLSLWGCFPEERRIGFSYSALMAQPEQQLQRASVMLGLNPPLENHYHAPKRKMREGAGDPLSSHKFDRIVPATMTSTVDSADSQLKISNLRLQHLSALYAEVRRSFGEI